MNDSIDLRKRILKMRNINNHDFKSTNSLHSIKKNVDLNITKKEITPKNTQNDFENKNIIINNLKTAYQDENLDLLSNSAKQINTSYDPQFRLLADKFNEAVEVILELSESVKNLEKIVYLKDEKIKSIKKKIKFPDLKLIVFIIISFSFVIGIIYLPINLLMLKLIIRDISSLM